MKKPSISQYLISTCLVTIDELNEKYEGKTKEELKAIADSKFNEMDITVMLGYPFKQMAHYTNKKSNEGSKVNHDLCIESKDFQIEVKYLRNWQAKQGNHSNKTVWKEFQKDFDWLGEEIVKGCKHKRAFVIGWFNCVDSLGQSLQLGTGRGSKPLVDEHKLAYFPFLKRLSSPTYTRDLAYNYDCAYDTTLLNLIGEDITRYNCIFLGQPEDVFHFAIYF